MFPLDWFDSHDILNDENAAKGETFIRHFIIYLT
jgi:hypothetical protein